MTNLEIQKNKEMNINELEKSVITYFESLTNKLSEVQKREFYMLCKIYNLNPLKREIYAVSFKDKFNVITNYNEYLKRADSTGLLEYYEVTVDEKEIAATKRMMPYKATFVGKRKDWTKELKVTIYFNEFSSGVSTWLTKPFFMIEKCALAMGLRRLFPNEIGNMPYINEELWFYNKENEEVVKEHAAKENAIDIGEQDMTNIIKKVGK